MKKIFITLSVLLFSGTLMAQGINFETKSYAEVLKQAKKENKLVFIDVYTSWCGPCKAMSANIFTTKVAGDFYNTNFINLKVDAEKSEDGKRLAKEFSVNAYPTLLFVNGDGRLTYRFMGGRMLDGFIDEGKKALEAYAAQPELDKYTKQFKAGERGQDFLNAYYILLSKSGLNPSEVLYEYFKQVNDQDLFTPENLSRIEKLSVYDKNFADRTMTEVMKISKTPGIDAKRVTAICRSLGKYYSASLSFVSKFGTESDFDHLMKIKDSFLTINGNSNSVTTATLGGGTFYLPAELIKLDYYKAKKLGSKFISVYDKYIVDSEAMFVEKNKMIDMINETNKALRLEAEKNNDKQKLSEIKKSEGFVGLFVQMDMYYIASNLINDIEAYDEFYAGVKDKFYQEKLLGWYESLFNAYPSVQFACDVADKFVNKNLKTKAITILTTALDKGKTLTGATPEHVTACENKLAELNK